MDKNTKVDADAVADVAHQRDRKANTAHKLAISSAGERLGQARASFVAGDSTAAEALCQEVLRDQPGNSEFLRLLIEIRKAENNSRAVAELMGRLVELEPANFALVNELTLLHLGSGNAAAGETYARHAVRIAPDNPQSHNLMGVALTEIGRAAAGEYHHRKALELSGRRVPMVLANLALNLKNQGRIDEARVLYRESDEAAPDVVPTLLGWARLEEVDRKFDAAVELLDKTARLKPDSPAVALERATILGREKRYDEALALLRHKTEDAAERWLRPVELLERGRLLDQMGRYDEAWADFSLGKSRAKSLAGFSYPEREVSEHAEDLKAFFTRDRTALLPRATTRTDVAQPIFILGFPRSGTTLLEQTLSACPSIAAGDELPLINEIAAASPRVFDSPWKYPGSLTELWMGDQRDGLDILRDHYLQRARQMGAMRDGASLFTDKMPLNEVNLGLIGLIFPKAPLIHLIRHPLDVMVSAMSNLFTHGGCCSFELETAAKHLLLTADLVSHYRREMDLNYLAVRYEDIIDDQAATVERVFDFIGVPFDPAVLAFEKNVRYARTASYAQVTEKLYDRSRYRYRNYLKHLGPALTILNPLIERLGYTVDTESGA